MKCSKLHITRYICGQPLTVNKDLVSLVNGFPKKFLFLKVLIDSNDFIKIRGVMTLLSFTRAIVPTKEEEKTIEVKFNSITDVYKGKNYSIPMYFIKDFIKNNHLSCKIPEYDRSLHYFSSKGSPFGKATITAPYALFTMMNVDQSMLQNYLKLLGENQYMRLFGNFMKKLWKDHRLMSAGDVNNGFLGKLSIIKDPELKRRVIAMLDYNSQLLLRPIHDDLLRNLSKLKQDRTFTQNPHNNWKPHGNKFWSLDLSSATDRFPIDLQVKVISAMYNNRDFANAWKSILIERGFSHKEKSFTYRVGQPMGAYSSWGAFTLSHHLVVSWCGHICGYPNFKDYIILGDDIVINNDKVANKYIKIMTKLGVDISLNKTHISRNTYEFAKRWIRKGIEVSPLPLKGILLNITKPLVVLQQLLIYCNNNRVLCTGSSLDIICLLYNNIKLNKRFMTVSSTHRYCYDFYHILKYAFNQLSPSELRKYLISKLGDKSLIEVSDENRIHAFMREALVLGLAKQAEKSGNEISKLADDFINIYAVYPQFDYSHLKDHPLLNALYNRTLSIKRELMKVSNSKELDLIDCMNAMKVEKIDKIVSLKRNTVETVAQLDKLWKTVIKELKFINENNYGNYGISQFGTFKDLKPWEGHYLYSLDISKNKFDMLREGINPNAKYEDMDMHPPMW